MKRASLYLFVFLVFSYHNNVSSVVKVSKELLSTYKLNIIFVRHEDTNYLEKDVTTID